MPARLAQTKPARDYTAQHFRGVPPWIVSFGATFIANGNTVSRIS